MMFKKIMSSLLICVMLFSLSACGKKDNANNKQEAQQTIDFQNFDKEKYKGVTLNMYCVTDNVRKIMDEFEKDTGIKVEHMTMKNGEILQRLKNEKTANKVIADVWYTGGADTFIDAAKNDLLEAYDSNEGKALSKEMKDPNGYWYGTSLTIVNLVINKDLIEKKSLKMPETWDDLLQPGLKGEVSMSDPASSGTAYNIISAVLQSKGEEEGWKYIEKLMEQVPFFTPKGSDPANNVVNGEAIVGINPSNGDSELEKNNPFIKLAYPSDGTGWWPQPVAIVKGSKNIEASKILVEWLLSKKGMEVIAKERYAAVARQDISIPEGIVDIKNVKLLPVDFQAGAANRDQVLSKWKELLEKKSK